MQTGRGMPRASGRGKRRALRAGVRTSIVCRNVSAEHSPDSRPCRFGGEPAPAPAPGLGLGLVGVWGTACYW